MPRALKTDKFFFYTAKKSGHWKGKIMIGVNGLYEGGINNISIQDLIDFLAKNEINPSNVEINNSFIVYAKK